MKIKVLYIISTLVRHGPINQLKYLIKFLDRQNVEPVIITLSRETSTSLIEEFKKLDIKIIQINRNRLVGFLFNNYSVNKIIDRYQPNIVQTFGFRPDRLKIKQKVSRIINIRTRMGQAAPLPLIPKIINKMLSIRLYKFHLRTINNYDNVNVVFCSKSLQLSLKNYINKGCIVIANGVDKDKYIPISKDLKISERKNFGFHKNQKIYVTINRLLPEKNIQILIHAFNSFDFLSNSILLIVGSGIEHDNLKKMSNGNKNIHLVGESKDVLKYLHISDFYISASLGEGLPNAVLEGMSTGLPCLLSDIPSHKEILKNSNAGLLFKNNNIQDFEKKLKELNKLDLNELSNNSIKHIDKYFSAKSMSKKYQKFYKKVISNTL